MGMWISCQAMTLGLLRALLLLLSLACLTWSSALLPSFWLTTRVRDVSTRLVANEHFKPAALDAVLSWIEEQPGPRRSILARVEALIRLRVLEEPIERMPTGNVDGELTAAEDRVRSALFLNPADGFLWLMLYSVETTRLGFSFKNLRYFDQSYTTAPREGWIALRRNRLGLSIFSALPEHSQQRVVSEFAGMVDSGFIDAAGANLAGVGWAQRDNLLASLIMTDIIPREALAKMLAREGVKASVPGVNIDERWLR